MKLNKNNHQGEKKSLLEYHFEAIIYNNTPAGVCTTVLKLANTILLYGIGREVSCGGYVLLRLLIFFFL